MKNISFSPLPLVFFGLPPGVRRRLATPEECMLRLGYAPGSGLPLRIPTIRVSCEIGLRLNTVRASPHQGGPNRKTQ
jgi:hypothetical protein